MEPDEYVALAQVEETHPWFCRRRDLVEMLVRRFAQRLQLREVLDAGCGTGANLRRWAKWKPDRLVGVDIDHGALQHCRTRVPEALFVRADLTRLPLANRSFDLAICTDVIEHIADDVGVLSELRRVLRPDGMVVLTTPAYRAAYSHHDRHLQHVRRYDAADLARAVREAGFAVVYWTRFNVLVTPFLWAYRRFFSKPGRSDVGKPLPPLARRLLNVIWTLEAATGSRLQIGFGMTHAVVLRPAAGRSDAFLGPGCSQSFQFAPTIDRAN